jgi:hypothetical protein
MDALNLAESILVYLVVVIGVLYWAALIGDAVEEQQINTRARRIKHNNNKPATLTYGDESPAEVERMYREAGLIK